MFCTLLWTITMLCRLCLADGDAVAHPHIFPSLPVIERGSALKVYCNLGKKLADFKNASHIIWKLNGELIAEENYTAFNDSVSELIIHNFTYEKADLQCLVDVDSPVKRQYVDHTVVKSGFPPEALGNISCILYYRTNFTCSWTSAQATHIETNYTFIRKGKGYGDESSTCTSNDSSCSSFFSDHSFSPLPFCVEVKAKNILGEVISKCVPHELQKILKHDPPRITNLETIGQMLSVTWIRSQQMPDMNAAKCQIRYRATTENHLGVANDFMDWKVWKKSFNLTNLWDSTNYTVAVRCRLNESIFWSEWSDEKTKTTEEQAPLKVDLWRVIESHQPTGNRTVHLLWKERKEFPSSGKIQSYTISKKFAESKSSFEPIINTSNKTVTLNLTGDAYEFSVVAHNTAKTSSEAILRIPSSYEESNDTQRITMLKSSPLHEEVVVEWTSSDLEINGYVVEWYASDMDISKRSWQYIRNATTWTSPKGAFKPGRCYTISVYPLHGREIKVPHSVEFGFHEGPPSVGPTPERKSAGKNDATITWKEIPKANTNGCLIKYTVFYKPDGGQELGETVNASVLQYQLKSLQSNTMYTVHVMASTSAGGKNGTSITFNTHMFSTIDMVLMNTVIGLFILFLLIMGLLWALKRHALKRLCWPKIPHPTLSGCSDLSEKMFLREPPAETDIVPPDRISVLETDAHCEKEVLLSNSENCFKEANDTAREMPERHEMMFSTDHEDSMPVAQTSSYVEQDLRNQPICAKVCSEDHDNEELQVQTSLEGKTICNPYLKSLVPTRAFLACENSSDQETKTQADLAPGWPKQFGQPYVAVDIFEKLSKHS
ncbi:interleukin-31 receptor subunit alpha isoform X2 [Hemicordylus capensis]|nr:interleukin-31 receptor subunit alpha isoform X2 [Hemicordylus capensis]XP_053159563.1 interleukin-31 receptor subunit alpha isoform X2 [Hemicordylus capensis]